MYVVNKFYMAFDRVSKNKRIYGTIGKSQRQIRFKADPERQELKAGRNAS